MKRLILNTCTLAVLLIWAGCASAPEARVSTPVLAEIDPAKTPEKLESPVWVSGVDRIYRMGDQWVLRREGESRPILLPEPTRRLLTQDLQTTDISLQPAPLTQELASELIRLRELTAQNAEAMDRMNGSTREMTEVARQMVARNAEVVKALEKSREAKASLPPPEMKE